MAAARVLGLLLLVAFAVQLVMAGVTRRDTESEPVAAVSAAIENMRSQLNELAERNITELFGDLSTQLQSLGTRLSDLANRVSEQLANNNALATAAPASR
ncbi:hypothetical protein R5R35_008212 [Gryllus longicercus]|uniref:Accessory gland protein n=1 Tax=Gryllus longicercus TaxID=2509291 RepID=A0AAN9YUL6_9ORTH